MDNYISILENGLRFGHTVLMEDLTEEIDPVLEPIFNKSIKLFGNEYIIKFNEKDLKYNENFKFYLSTKFANPTYSPELSAKVTLVNF
mmetsp:Transcript_3717/g.2208  ORF Transcript_3717/g.2208 Transcript_3717/m.2208 type:complete len:88 (+) Transcript_3717:4063-4326(+)